MPRSDFCVQQERLPKLAWHIEEPRVGQSYPNYYAAQLAIKFVKVVLSGAGGDELFGGYPWRYYRWFKGESIDYVRRMVLDRRARIYEVLDRDAVTRLVNDHLDGRENRRLLIWSLISLENWYARFLS